MLSTITINGERQQIRVPISKKSLLANEDPFPSIKELLSSKKSTPDKAISVNAGEEQKSADELAGEMLTNLIRERPERWNICLPV